MNIRNVQMIDGDEWDAFIEETYGKPYTFQQQAGCIGRGITNITIPDIDYDEEMNDSIPEEVNGEKRGVKFAVWLARDPKQPIVNQEYRWQLKMFWDRSFYPDLRTVANDLHKKGLIEAGDYVINVDW